MEQHEKKAAFIRQAEKNKENFDLHQKLIEKHFGKVEYSFLLTAMAYSEEYAVLHQPLVMPWHFSTKLQLKHCLFNIFLRVG